MLMEYGTCPYVCTAPAGMTMALAALCLQVFARIPRRPSKEFRWGCHPGWCPLDVGQTPWCCDDFQCLKQGCFIPSSREWERMWLSLEYTYPNKFRYSRHGVSWPESNRSLWRRWSGIASMKALVLSISECWPTRLSGENPVTYSELLLAAQKAGKMGRSQRSSAPTNHYCWEFEM